MLLYGKNKKIVSSVSVTILAYSILCSIFYIGSYIKAFIFKEHLSIVEFKLIYHMYIWVPVLLFIIYNILRNIIENSKRIEIGTIREMPSKHHPMMINYLMNKKFTKNGFTSTIMLLINKGYLELGIGSIGYFLIDKKKISEQPFFNTPDEYLIQALFRQFAIDEKLYLSSLSKKNKDFNFIFENYSMFFYNSKYYKKLMNGDSFIFILFTLLFSYNIFISVVSVAHYNIIYSIIIIVVYSIIFSKSMNMKWRNKEGRSLYRKWYCYKKFLEEYTSLHEKELKEITIWDSYLIVAVALDINTKNSNSVFEDIKLGEYDVVRNLPKIHFLGEKRDDDNSNSTIVSIIDSFFS